ncbi:hypothetical protein BUALT_Bualt02G0208100 [Buddleja alternifolia]|uniref:Uncharacterized protein n=1 Tax=Buddleja alternifolia TaxID=168488 RepID=A0AAV6Y3E2_9LAMI|nr:hypothetical protein BUALT_Bualt02G0208100 [Buddleja alternifolia]
MRSSKVTLAIIIALVFLLSTKSYEATRILDEDEQQWMKKDQKLLLQSFQRGSPTGPPSPNGCTWVPGSGGPPCKASISEQNFAVIASPPPPVAAAIDDAYPEQMVQFGVAVESK